MAFQPIVDVTRNGAIFAHEALVRGPNGEGAASLPNAVPPGGLYAFDAACRKRAVELAASLRLPALLSVNVTPGAICDSDHGVHATIQTAIQAKFPRKRLILEVTEMERIQDVTMTRKCLDHYRSRGILIALDDFGAGYNGLNTLIELRPDIVKLDIELIRGIDADQTRQIVVRSIIEMARKLAVRLIAEGVETEGEARMLRSLGIDLMQGYLFAKPAPGALPWVDTSAIVGGMERGPSSR
jgi:EAL domain-containing protein (putative c-di-GMP-specific phosphodiesterase class I)